MSLTIWSYKVLYLFMIDVIFYQAKLLMFHDVQTTNLTFVSKICVVHHCGIPNSK